MTSTRDDSAPGHDPAAVAVTPLSSAPVDPSGAPTDLFPAIDRHPWALRRDDDFHALRDSIDRHPTTLGQRLGTYLDAVVRELHDRGVLTGAAQHTDPEHRLMGSIVLDCTSLRIAAWTPSVQRPRDRQSLGAAVHPERPSPVVATWDEHDGWCVGLHHDPSTASRRYLHPDLLPAAQTVAEFVVDLALGHISGADHPITTATGPGHPRLRLVP